VPLTSRQRKTIGIGAGIALVPALAIGGLAATATSQTRGSLLHQLERPAAVVRPAAAVDARAGRAAVTAGGLRFLVSMSPNHAAVRDRLTIVVSARGRPVARARVSISFSMPAMNMWSGLTTQIPASGPGTYAATEPILGMPGVWQLRVTIGAPGRPTTSFLVNDRLPA
jgi:nitrogen fixation protein FixH